MDWSDYFEQNGQNKDRPALLWFNRILRREVSMNNPLVIELGSGTGFLSRRIEKWASLSVIEPNLEDCEFVTMYYSNSASIKFNSIETCMAKIPSHSIDCVVALHVLEHISDLNFAVDFIKHILKPDGKLIIAVPDATGDAAIRKGSNWSAFKDPTHIHFLGSSEWVQIITDKGFKLKWEGTDGMWDIPYGRSKWRDFMRYFPKIALSVLVGRVIIRRGYGETYIGCFSLSTIRE